MPDGSTGTQGGPLPLVGRDGVGGACQRSHPMSRLISAGLMFGNLIEVSSPALIERYNRALKHLTGKTTRLTDFHIDLSG